MLLLTLTPESTSQSAAADQPAAAPPGATLLIPCRPQPLKIDPKRTAVVVVDMQNAFCRKGGLIDILEGRLDETVVGCVVEADKKVIEAARKAGMKVVYLRYAFRPDLSDAGGPESPHYYKNTAVWAMVKDPSKKGRFITQGSWDAEIINELRPQAGDIVVDKNRFSGFPNTNLDAVLKTHGIKYLVFLGIATNICVESTLRDAFFHEYFSILVSDGCGQIGPPFTQDATVFVVESLFGWVTTSEDFVKAVK